MANILIIDDDYSVRILFQFVFMEAGHTSQLARDGREALEKLDSFCPDIMLVDISMPVMDGSRFIEELKKLALTRPELRGIPFIVLTGDNFMKMDENYGFGKNPDCRAFLPKTTQQATVLSIVEKVLREHGKI